MKAILSTFSVGVVAKLFVLLSIPANSAELIITVRAPAAPDEIMAIIGSSMVKGSYDPGSEAYKVVVSEPALTEARERGSVIAEWEDGRETLCVHIGSKPVVELRIYHRAMPATFDTIRRLKSRGPDLISTLETYFDSRRVWRTFVGRGQGNHWLAITAADIWHDAALGLTRFPGTAYCMDEEAASVIRQYETEGIKIGYFSAVLKEIRNPKVVEDALGAAGSWQGVDVVRRLIENGDFITADALNRQNLQKYRMASEDEQVLARQQYGVDLGALRTLQTQILVGMRQL